jgi:hypothetical protein
MARQNEAAVYGSTVKSDPEGEFSLVRGGPFYRLQEIIRLIDADRWNLGRRIVFAIAIGWVPLVLITAVFYPPALPSLIRDYPANARLLLAVPVLLAGQLVMEKTFRALTRHIREAGLLAREDLLRMDKIIAKLMRLRDSILPELLLLVAVYVHIAVIFHARVAIARPWEVVGSGADLHVSVAGWYYALVSEVLYEFLLLLSVWKWFLWSYFLFRLSRLNLLLVATHPDHHGGIGFLGLSPIAAAPMALTASAVIGSVWRTQILQHGAHLVDYKVQAIVLLASCHPHHLHGSTCIFCAAAGKAAASGNLAIRRTRATAQHVLSPQVDFAARRSGRGVSCRSRSKYSHGLRYELRQYRAHATLSLRSGSICRSGSGGCGPLAAGRACRNSPL